MSPRLRHPLSGPFISKSFFSPTSAQAPLLRFFGAWVKIRMHMLTYAEGNALLADPNPDLGAGEEAVVPNRSSIQGTCSLFAAQPPAAWRSWEGRTDLTVILDKRC